MSTNTRRVKEALQLEINKLQSDNLNGSLIPKAPGKQPPSTQKRKKFAISKYNITGWKVDMQLLAFLKLMLKNKAIFLRGYKQVAFKQRRKSIDDIQSFLEFTYPNDMEDCKSDKDCLSHIMLSTTLVTRSNLVPILKEMSKIFEQILYPQDDTGGAEHSARGALLTNIEKNRPDLYDPDDNESKKQATLWRKEYFTTSAKRWELHHVRDDARMQTALKKQILLHEYELLTYVDTLKLRADTLDSNDKDYIPTMQCLIQVSFGMRFIEMLTCRFALSTESKFDPQLYAIQTGAAKTVAKEKLSFNKSLREWKAAGKDMAEWDPDLEELDQLTMVPQAVIPKPVLFNSKGVTPEYFIETLKKMRKAIYRSYNEAGMFVPGCLSETDEKNWMNLDHEVIGDSEAVNEFRREYLAKTIRYMVTRLLPTKSPILTRGKTHNWRKVYACYSYKTIGEPSAYNIASWYKAVLFQSSETACFRYMTLNIIMGLEINQTSYSEFLSILGSYKTKIDFLQEKVLEFELGNVRMQTALPGIEDEFVYIGKINRNQFQGLDDDEKDKLDAYTELYDDLEAALVAMNSLTRQHMMNLGLTRKEWVYFNKEVLTPKLEEENERRINNNQRPLKRRRK